jgi:hypothetical protein
MLIRRGSRTKTAYISNAGMMNNQPIMVSRRTFLFRKVHRESVGTTGRVSDVTVDVIVFLAGAGIVPWP